MTALDTIVASAPPAVAPSLPVSMLARAGKLWHNDNAWSLADQGVASLGNFATTVLVIRGLSAADCGVYGFLLDLTMFVNTLHAPLLTYPLSIKAAAADRTTAGKLTTASLSFTAVAGILLVMTGAVAGLLMHRFEPLLLAAVGAMGWQLQEVVRRALIARNRLRAAAVGDAISYLGQAVCIFLMLRHGAVTLDRIFIAMAATSVAGLVFQAWVAGIKSCGLAELRKYAAEFWTLGRWPLAANLTTIFTVPAFAWTLIYFHGLKAAAENLALLALLKATNPVMFAAMNLIIPSVARAQSAGKTAGRIWRVFLEQAGFGTLILLPYFAVLGIFPAWVIGRAYGGKYVDCASILQVIVVSYALVYAANMTTAFLNGLGRTKSAFHGQLANTAAAAAVGLPLTAVFGLAGSAWGGGIAVLARLIANGISLWRNPCTSST